jgi:hypothetical protein
MSLPLSPNDYRRSAILVWEEYRKDQHRNEARIREHREQIITYRGKAMKYHLVKRGEEPDGGYPLYIALHGGSGESAEFNNKFVGADARELPAEYSQRLLRGTTWCN